MSTMKLELLSFRVLTLREMAQSALDIQSACNLSGVARSFAEVMMNLRRLPECQGTAWANSHPVALLYIGKMADMAGYGHGWDEAYVECERLARSQDQDRES